MKVAYILGTFPTLSETFILNGMLAIQSHDIEVVTFAFYRGLDKIIQPQSLKIKPIIYFPIPTMRQVIYSHLYWLARRPLAYLKFMVGFLFVKNFLPKNCIVQTYHAFLIAKTRPDHIHAYFGRNTADLAMVVHLLQGTPFTFSTHQADLFINPPHNYGVKSKLAKKHITISEYNKQHIVAKFGVNANDISIIHSAVNFDRLKNYLRKDQGDLVLSVGRLVQQKNMDVLIEACAILKSRDVHFRCLIVGDGAEKAHLAQLIESLGVTDQVFLLGPKTQEEVFGLLAKTTVAALTSRAEGIPNYLMEAMALRVPVVATNVDGIPELVTDGVSGFLVPPNEPQLIAERIEMLLSNKSLREKYAEQGYQKVFTDFNIQTETNKWLDIWLN